MSAKAICSVLVFCFINHESIYRNFHSSLNQNSTEVQHFPQAVPDFRNFVIESMKKSSNFYAVIKILSNFAPQFLITK